VVSVTAPTKALVHRRYRDVTRMILTVVICNMIKLGYFNIF
jgi:hypothetical protein